MSNNQLPVFAGAAAFAVAVHLLLDHLKSKKSAAPKGSSCEAPANPANRSYLIGGNWKCNTTTSSALSLVSTLNSSGPIPTNCTVVVGVPYPYLSLVRSSLRSDIELAAQDCAHSSKMGAFTGEVNVEQLKDVGCTWVILGHSERRTGFGGDAGETSDLIAGKTLTAVGAGLKVMLCVGETLEERESGKTLAVVKSQLDPVVKVLKASDWGSVAIAYEPVWAIGTGKTATPEMAQETHAEIRSYISTVLGSAVAAKIQIQYGGSMKAANCKALLAQPDIDGGLIGGASLKPEFADVFRGMM
ncbi:hypothetical protein TrVE_jg5782 [Triparma verrucosa]|uniref:Triosephosphate isomerase n=2 Tax=Triparma TaxID=722752 RepID=A0A9W7AZ79_9STRA|nr:hypothetical protein TrST_g336 [Triparma strigata]GMH95697.1 hypothetical protein TrVE_jg5782 [Triparma verrucosa]